LFQSNYSGHTDGDYRVQQKTYEEILDLKGPDGTFDEIIAEQAKKPQSDPGPRPVPWVSAWRMDGLALRTSSANSSSV
jgi:hypothetical protein